MYAKDFGSFLKQYWQNLLINRLDTAGFHLFIDLLDLAMLEGAF